MRKLIIVNIDKKNKVFKEISKLILGIEFGIDKDFAKQVLFELVLNAQKYGQGGIEIWVDDNEERLELGVENEGGFYYGKNMKEKSVANRILQLNDIRHHDKGLRRCEAAAA